MNQEELERANKLKLDRLKGTWYHSTPEKLYDLCIRKVVRNINLIISKSPAPNKPSSKSSSSSSSKPKYRINESVGPLPNPICESLIREYAKYYVETLSQLERDEYFNNINNEAQQQQQQQANKPKRLISYYDVLMAFVCTPEKCSLATIDYRQCLWATSTLETRLRQKLEAQLSRTFSSKLSEPNVQSNYFKIIKIKPVNNTNNSAKQRLMSSSSSESILDHTNQTNAITLSLLMNESTGPSQLKLSSIRSRQPPHLIDANLKSIIRNQKKLVYIDLCPCMLTNRTILWINKYLSAHLKCLRLQNCCNWTSTSEQTVGGNGGGVGVNNEENIFHNIFDAFVDPDRIMPDFFNNETNNAQRQHGGFDELVNYRHHRGNHRNEGMRRHFVVDDEEINDLSDDEDDAMENFFDEDDDDNNFGAYLQEYVSRYEQYEQQQQQQQNSGDKATASGKKRRHKSGKRKKKKKHHRHECKHDLGMKSGAAAAAKQLQQHQIAKHSSSFSQKKKKKKSHRRKDKAKYDLRKLKLLNKQLLFGNNNLERTIGVIGGERTVERFPPCKLFMPASSLAKKPRHHTHHHHHHHHHGHTNNRTHKHHKASCRRHKSKKKKLHRHHHYHHHHSHKSHQKQAPSNRGVEEEMKTTSLNDNANEKVDNIASQTASQPQQQQQQQQPLMDTPTSILKWLVKRAILNTNAVGPNSNNNQASASSSQTQQQQQASNSEAGEASGGAGVRPSLIEQIKKKASLLAETKMIDKVSISSSNYDEYDLNNMNSGSIGGGSIGGGTGGESGSNQIDWQSINDPDGDSADMIIMTGGELQPAQSNPNDTDENYKTKAPPGGSKFIADFDSNSFSSDSSSIYLSYHTNDSMKSSASRSSSISSSSSSSSLASSTSSSSTTSCSSTTSSSSSMSLLSSLSLLSTSSPASSGSSSGSSSSDHSSCSSSYSSCCSSSYECDSCDMDSLASSSSITSSSSSMSSSSSDFDSSSSLSSSSSDADEDATERQSKLLKPGESNQSAIEKRRYIKNKRRRLSKKLKEISERLSETAEAASGENAVSATLPSTSSSSAPPAVLDNTAAKSEELAAAVLSSKKVQRQQKLLEKVANLGSSPINVIQAIAAKALNFKLKNSRAAAMKSQSQQLYHHNHGHHRHHHHHHHHNNNSSRYPPSHLGRQDSSSSASSLANVKRLSQLDFDTASKRRLLRQYKFLKSTNMTQVGGASSLSAAAAVDESSSQALDELIRNLNNQVSSELQQQQQQQQESKLTAINDEAMSTSTPPNSDHTLDVNYNKSKRLKEEHAAHKRNASASNDVEMTAAGDRPGTSKSFEQQQSQQQQQQQQNQQQSLFSVLKYWMSKRVDPIGSNEAIAVKDSSPPRTTVEGSSSKMIEGEESTSPRQQNKRKSTDQKMPVDTQPCEESNLNNSALVDLKSKQQHLKKKKSSKSSSHHRSGHHKRKEKEHRHHHHHHRHHKRPHHHHHHHHHQSSSQPKSSTTNRRNLPSLPSPPQPHVDQMLVETLNLSKLQHLSLRNLGPYVIKRTMLNSLLKNFKCLKYLDISNCCTNQLFIVRPATSSMDLVGGSGDSTSSVAAAAAAVVVDMTRMISNAAGGVNAAATVGEAQPQASTNQPNELVGCLDGLTHLAPTLTHLLMADLNVDDIQANLKFILKLKALKHLDISNCREKPPLNRYKNPSLLLGKLAHHLTSLTSLDISGTNLTGSTIFKEQDEIDYIKKRLYDDLSDEYNDYARVKLDAIETISSGIAGLMFLNNEHKRLDFLGCFCCDNSIGARAAPIPATRIAAESAEAYLYAALECFLHDRPLFLLDALNHLFELYRDESVEDKLWGGHLIMDTMERHLDNSRIQISGSASLFYVLKYCKEENVQLPSFYLKRLILAVINGMEQHIDESAMRRNCVLIMCRLNLPDDVLFVSDRLIRILLKIFEDYVEERQKNANDRPEHFVLRTAMHLLNILACSVHGNDKSKVGALSIPVAMSLIRTKTKFKEPDDVLEVTWSFLWNITDETPENCETFLDKCDGMSAFMECIQFKKSEILRNMMGLLGNVAEVKALRNRLCKNELISTFRELLFQTNDGIEIAYNSAGVLVHIMSDGAEAWIRNLTGDETTPVLLTERDSVILDIETAIDKWDLNSDRNINYRSFQPIFRLVEQFENPICQRWASWALANLTTVYPNTYCPLFEREQGRELMERVLNDSNVNDTIKRYANIVLHNVDRNKL